MMYRDGRLKLNLVVTCNFHGRQYTFNKVEKMVWISDTKVCDSVEIF